MKKTEFAEMLVPWFWAALYSTCIPILLLVISTSVPELQPPLVDSEDGPSAMESASRWFKVFNYLALILPTLVYGVIGLIPSIRSFDPKAGWRMLAAKGLLTLSLAGLFYLSPLLAATWLPVQKMGLTPPGTRLEFEWSRNPWLDGPLLENTVGIVVLLPLLSFILAVASFIFKPNRYAIAVGLALPFIFFLLFISHFWIIE